jgi:hypothetical protein
MKLMIDTIKEAIDIFAAESSQVNLDSSAARESLAEFIDKYILDEFEEDPQEEEDCCGNDCGCH